MPVTKNGGINFCDLPSYSLDFDMTPDSGGIHSCTRTVQVAWPDVHGFPVAVLGDASVGKTANNRFGLKRLLPEQHPKYPHLFATRCALQNGQGAHVTDADDFIQFIDNKTRKPGYGVFQITYSTLQYAVREDPEFELSRYVTRREKFGLEVYQVPGTAFRWETAPPIVAAPTDPRIVAAPGALQRLADFHRIIAEPVPLQRPIDELVYTWHWVPEPIPYHIYNIMGHVNKNPFDGLDDAPLYPPGFLLLTAIEKSERKHTPAGTNCRDIRYTFSLRPDTGWNKFYRKTTGDFVGVLDLNGKPLYADADFNLLFAIRV